MLYAIDLFRQRRGAAEAAILAQPNSEKGLSALDAELANVQRQLLRQGLKPNQQHLVEAGFEIIRKALPLMDVAATVRLRVRQNSTSAAVESRQGTGILADAAVLATAGTWRFIQIAVLVALVIVVLANPSASLMLVLLLLVVILVAEYQAAGKGRAIAAELRAAVGTLLTRLPGIGLAQRIGSWRNGTRERQAGAGVDRDAALLGMVESQRGLDATVLLQGVEDLLTVLDAAAGMVTDRTAVEAGRLSDSMLEFLQAMAGLAWRQRADRLMERVTDLLPGALASHGYDFESLAETTESARDVHFTFDRNPDRSAKDKVMLRPAILHNGALIKRGTVLTPREWPAAEPAKQDEAG